MRLGLAALAATALTGCGGDSTGPLDGDLFLSFRANGSLVEFRDRFSLLAAFSSSGSQSVLLITGFEATSNAGIQIYDGQPITTGTYSGFVSTSAGSEGVLITYVTPEGVLYGLDTTGPVDATVTITEIGGARIRGTFSGTISDGETSLVITDGEFLVARTN
ncbi:MAG TPA: hypothetical protein VLA09_14385 [Longimicrobiales bacterium]|nr:hypothetical protein [Longimicrobiales bacterium]